ncbi:MAG: hypothetical protein HY443_00875 [Candidatus Nealsonbacteria bacterium]|nr:hypothetical protein [Candidatus Nealsonbacteria bacterium]
MSKKFFLILVVTGILSFVGLMVGGKLAPELPPGFTLPPQVPFPSGGEIVKPLPPVTFTAFDHFNLRNFMGYPLGGLYGFAVLRFVLTSVWFVVAVFFLLRYLKGFYGSRQIPLSWLLIVASLIVTNIAEIGENFTFHEWPYLGILEHNFLLILPHLWGGILMFLGTWFLLKEVRR